MKKFVTIACLLICCVCLAALVACEKPCAHSNTKWVVDTEPTCTEAGSRHQICADCNEILVESQTITALGHTLEKGVCSRCGYKHQTSGLQYAEILSEESGQAVAFAVSGIGNATDSYIVLPNEHNGLPVTTINANAFADCNKLTNVVLSENTLRVESYAFENCSALVEVVIPDGVRHIGWYAFSGCSSLAKVEIPQSVLNVDKYAFDKCTNLQEISVAEGNLKYKSVDGNMYDKSGATLLRYAIGKSADAFEVPSSVKTLSDGCFADSTLKTVTFAQDGRLATIGSKAFFNCQKLASFNMPNTVTILSEYAFGSCRALSQVVLSENVITLNGGIFSDCSSLQSIVIPKRVRVISAIAFSACGALQSIEVEEGNTFFKSVEGNLYSFDGSKLIKYASAKKDKEFVLPASVTGVGEYAFERCNSLQKVVVSSHVTEMGKSAFYNCDSLTVFCEAEEQPATWSDFWLYHSSSEIRVEWGYKD